MITFKKDEKTNVTSIYRDQNMLICPYRPPIAVPGQLAGQISLLNNPCNSLCPFFTDNDNGTFTLKCKDVTLWTDKKPDYNPPILTL